MKARDTIDQLLEAPEYVIGTPPKTVRKKVAIDRVEFRVYRRSHLPPGVGANHFNMVPDEFPTWNFSFTAKGKNRSYKHGNIEGQARNEWEGNNFSRPSLGGWLRDAPAHLQALYRQEIEPKLKAWVAEFERLDDHPKEYMGARVKPDITMKPNWDVRSILAKYRYITGTYSERGAGSVKEKIYRFNELRKPDDKLVFVNQYSPAHEGWQRSVRAFYLLLNPEELAQFNREMQQMARAAVGRVLDME